MPNNFLRQSGLRAVLSTGDGQLLFIIVRNFRVVQERDSFPEITITGRELHRGTVGRSVEDDAIDYSFSSTGSTTTITGLPPHEQRRQSMERLREEIGLGQVRMPQPVRVDRLTDEQIRSLNALGG